MMLSVDLRSLSRHGALILPSGGPRGTESVCERLSVLDETALSCIRSLSVGGPACACSALGEQMGDVWSHLTLLAEYAAGGVRSVTLRALVAAGASLAAAVGVTGVSWWEREQRRTVRHALRLADDEEGETKTNKNGGKLLMLQFYF